jgi:hypothetical protein
MNYVADINAMTSDKWWSLKTEKVTVKCTDCDNDAVVTSLNKLVTVPSVYNGVKRNHSYCADCLLKMKAAYESDNDVLIIEEVNL